MSSNKPSLKYEGLSKKPGCFFSRLGFGIQQGVFLGGAQAPREAGIHCPMGDRSASETCCIEAGNFLYDLEGNAFWRHGLFRAPDDNRGVCFLQENDALLPCLAFFTWGSMPLASRLLFHADDRGKKKQGDESQDTGRDKGVIAYSR